jgi:hypothetical protein
MLHKQICNGREVLLLNPNERVDNNPFETIRSRGQGSWAAIHGRVRGGQYFNDFVRIV